MSLLPAGLTPPSIASRRSAATACRCSPRARACGGRRRTSRRRSPGSASGAREAGIGGVVCHALYLCNLAAPDDEIYEKSIATMRATVDAASAIGADAVIFHVGSHLGAGLRERARPHGARRSRRSSSACDGDTWLLLENSAGTGGTIGRSLEELATIIERARTTIRGSASASTRVTCIASGYDVTDPKFVDALVTADRRRRSASTACARCTSTTAPPRSARTATGTRTSSKASSAKGSARSSPTRRSRTCARTSKSPASTGRASAPRSSGRCATCTRAGPAESDSCQTRVRLVSDTYGCDNSSPGGV